MAHSLIKIAVLWNISINGFQGDKNHIPVGRYIIAAGGGTALFVFLSSVMTKKIMNLATHLTFRSMASQEEQEGQAWLKAFFKGAHEKVEMLREQKNHQELMLLTDTFLSLNKSLISVAFQPVDFYQQGEKIINNSLLSPEEKVRNAFRIIAPSLGDLEELKTAGLSVKDRAFRFAATLLTGLAAWATWDLLRESFLQLVYIIDDVSPLYPGIPFLDDEVTPFIDPIAGVATGFLFFITKGQIVGFLQKTMQYIFLCGDQKKSTHVSLYPKGTRALWAVSLLWGAFFSLSIWGFGQHMIHWNTEDWSWFTGDVKKFFVVSLAIATAEDAIRKSREFQGGMRAVFFHLLHNRLTKTFLKCTLSDRWYDRLYGNKQEQEAYKFNTLLRQVGKSSETWSVEDQQRFKSLVYGQQEAVQGKNQSLKNMGAVSNKDLDADEEKGRLVKKASSSWKSCIQNYVLWIPLVLYYFLIEILL